MLPVPIAYALTPKYAWQVRVNRALWLALFAFAALIAVWMMVEGLTLRVHFLPVFLFMFAVWMGVSMVQRRWLRDERLFLYGDVMAQSLAIGILVELFMSLCVRTNLPLMDEYFIAFDRLLGFDWQRFIAWADTWPEWFLRLLTFAYGSFGLQFYLLAHLLFILRKSAQAQRLIIVIFATGVLTMIIAALLPGVAGYVHYDVDISAFQHLKPGAARVHEELYLALRDHASDTLVYPSMGVITFPSYHTTSALFLIYGWWSMPYLRWPLLGFNLLMLLSVPIDGGHWLSDVIGGIIVALLGIWLAERVLPRKLEAAAAQPAG